MKYCTSYWESMWFDCIDPIRHVHTYYPHDVIGPGLSVDYDYLYDPWSAPTYVDHINTGLDPMLWIPIVGIVGLVLIFILAMVLGMREDRHDRINNLEDRVGRLESKGRVVNL